MPLRDLETVMTKLKTSLKIFFITTLLSSCAQTVPSYKELMRNSSGIEILIDANRINATCEDASGDDKIHVLLVHVLNEKQMVDDYVYGMAYPKEICTDLKKQIDRVIKNGTKIYLAAIGKGKPDPTYSDIKYTFAGLGEFPITKVCFSFEVIKNEKGQCFGFAHGNEKDGTCKKAGVDFLVGSPVSGY